MDALSIATASLTFAQVLFKSTECIVKFCQDAKEVDKSVQNLVSQAEGLERALKSLGSALQDEVFKTFRPGDRNLWDGINAAVKSCGQTVYDLEKKLESVPTGRDNIVGKAWRQFLLGFKQDGIDKIISEMNTHSVHLQLSLATLNL